MSTMDHASSHEALHRTLIQRAGRTATPGTIAEATLGTWRDMETRLIPVIGVRGVDALFWRALHLAGIAFPWLESDKVRGNVTDHLVSLQTRIETRNTADAAEASYSLLVIFTGLLENLIGSSLTKRLLAPVWVSPSISAEQDSAP